MSYDLYTQAFAICVWDIQVADKRARPHIKGVIRPCRRTKIRRTLWNESFVQPLTSIEIRVINQLPNAPRLPRPVLKSLDPWATDTREISPAHRTRALPIQPRANTFPVILVPTLQHDICPTAKANDACLQFPFHKACMWINIIITMLKTTAYPE